MVWDIQPERGTCNLHLFTRGGLSHISRVTVTVSGLGDVSGWGILLVIAKLLQANPLVKRTGIRGWMKFLMQIELSL